MKQKKRRRNYSVDKLSASAHPLRLSLIDLIKQGVNTAPKMAEVLNENRMNLYHHLNYLEKSGIIISYFDDRVKKYRINDKQKTDRTYQDTIIDTSSIILTPNSDNKKEFVAIVNNLLTLNKVKIDDSMEITQVHVILKPFQANVMIQQNIESMVKRQKSKQI